VLESECMRRGVLCLRVLGGLRVAIHLFHRSLPAHVPVSVHGFPFADLTADRDDRECFLLNVYVDGNGEGSTEKVLEYNTV